MTEIRLLDSDTINQIAAGEVVERPSSVVKELVENAIDAHATAVSVEVKDGGVGMIRITDNGVGIEKSQVRQAFARHATSKIRSAGDLQTVMSLGFRGEALSSIAAVARVELFSKTADALAGIHYVIEGGEEIELSEAGMPDGTTFVIRNLFYNTPARRKFLKSNASETAKIQDLMMRLAFSHPEISFKLIVQGQTKLHTSGRHKLNEIIYEVYGRDVAGQLLEIHAAKNLMQIDGYIGRPVIGRASRSFEHYFINGRYIKNKMINSAIEDAYQGFLMQHKYPFVVLSITMPAYLVDCNVHPAKLEVRFSDGASVYEALKSCIAARLKEEEMILRASVMPPVANGPKQTAETGLFAEEGIAYGSSEKARSEPGNDKEDVAGHKQADQDAVRPYIPEPFEQVQRKAYEAQTEAHLQEIRREQMEAEQLELFDDRFLSKKAAASRRIIGQVFSTYWIVEYGDRMFLIDQHAAHEKVNYERMVRQLREKQMTSQQLCPPMILTLNAEEAEKLNVYQDYFAQLGYVIAPFGGHDYAVNAVPANLYGLVEKDLFYRILDELDLDTGRKSETLILERLASMSCKAAVKGGMKLSCREMEALLDELMELEDPYHCPHGRPVIVAFTKKDLERMFKRIV